VAAGVIATTRAAILRGTVEDVFGEPTDADVVAPGLDDFPASITERARSVYDPAEQTFRTVRELVGRIPYWVGLQDGDRLRDNRTGIVYIIDEDERTPRSISGRASVTLSLRRT
jgi:hypothetical protein